jgi:multicomponent Na+:H+ antiporter subunit E
MRVMMSEGKSLRPTIYVFVSVLGLWLLWSGHYTPLMNSFGVFSSLGVALLCRKLGLVDNETLPLHKTPGLLRYAPWLLWEIAKSNIDVARRILSPGLPISPRILKVKTTQKNDLFRVTYAHSITLTPGTLTIDADGDELTVHAIAAEHAEGLEEGEMDRRVTRFEGAS